MYTLIISIHIWTCNVHVHTCIYPNMYMHANALYTYILLIYGHACVHVWNVHTDN